VDQYGQGLPSGYAQINDRGQIAFAATLQGGGGALLLATPGGKDNSNVATITSAVAAPAPATLGLQTMVGLPGVSVSPASGNQSTSGQSDVVNATSRPASSRFASRQNTVVVLPRRAVTSLAAAPSSVPDVLDPWGKPGHSTR
jgi:hypothetical protein